MITYKDIINSHKEGGFDRAGCAVIVPVGEFNFDFCHRLYNYDEGEFFFCRKAGLNFVISHLKQSADMNTWKEMVRACSLLGARKFLFLGNGTSVTGADGLDGIVVSDHVDLSGGNPLIGLNDDTFGTRFPDMTGMYDKSLNDQIVEVAQEYGLILSEGVLMVPKQMNNLTDLEERALAAGETSVLSQDVYAGAITAKHAGTKSNAIIFFDDIDLKSCLYIADRLFRD